MGLQEATLILTQEQIGQKINRLAFQIYEQNFDEEELIICGLAERGYLLAERLFKKLGEISHFKLTLLKIKIDKDNPISEEAVITPKPSQLADKTVILCDDVLYTGKTMAYAAVPFLQSNVKKLQCLVLVHRHHLNFPIQPTFIGMSLATTLQEHVNVDLNESVYLK